MTRRRSTINIYDYPEHLNPFREDVDDNSDKFSTTGRRRSSFRVNAWNLFSPNKGKSQTSEDINPVNATATSRFMTWTPKLLRKASFRRSPPPSRPTQPLSPRESMQPISSRLSFRTSASRSTLPPSGSRSSLPPSGSRSTVHNSNSRSTLSSSDSRHTFLSSRPTSPPSRPTSPPSRPAPPNVRTSLSPSRPYSPPSVTTAVTPSTENVHNNVITGSKQTTPVPASRKALFPTTPEKTAGEQQPSEDETKYIQQGAKPKKKRRAPAPPTPSPGKPSSDNRPVNSNESDASMTSSVTSSSAEEPPATDQTAVATRDLTLTIQESERHPKDGELEQQTENDTLEHKNEEQTLDSENKIPEQHSENATAKDPGKLENKDSDEPHSPVNGVAEHGDQTSEEGHADVNDEETKKPGECIENGVTEHAQHGENQTPQSENYIIKLQQSPEKQSHKEDEENRSENHNMENGLTEHRNQIENSVHNFKNDSDIPESLTEKPYRLHNGANTSPENFVLQNGKEMTTENKKHTPQLTPEPKPRTILPEMTKN